MGRGRHFPSWLPWRLQRTALETDTAEVTFKAGKWTGSSIVSTTSSAALKNNFAILLGMHLNYFYLGALPSDKGIIITATANYNNKNNAIVNFYIYKYKHSAQPAWKVRQDILFAMNYSRVRILITSVKILWCLQTPTPGLINLCTILTLAAQKMSGSY